MKRFLLVFLVLLVGCFCLSAETIKGTYYEDGVKYIYTWSKYPVEDEFGIFSISEAQELLESLGWDDYYVSKENGRDIYIKMEEEIFETLSDDVDFPEENNLIELRYTKDDETKQLYLLKIDFVHNSFNDFFYYTDTLIFIKK